MRRVVIRVNGRRVPRIGHYLTDEGLVHITPLGAAIMWAMALLPGPPRAVGPGGKVFKNARRNVTFDYE